MKPLPADSSFQRLTATARGRRLLEQELLLVSAAELISARMQEKKVTRAELAARIGKSKSFVTQILRGQHNMTLRTLADLAWALDARVELRNAPWTVETQSPSSRRREREPDLGNWEETFIVEPIFNPIPQETPETEAVSVPKREKVEKEKWRSH